MPTSIRTERPDSPAATALISELEATLDPLYPVESRHGYSIEKLLRERVAFFVLRYEGAEAGCGGIQLCDADYAELKRMYVRPQYRGLGLSKVILIHLEEYARSHGITRLRLETGIYQTEAIGLYERFGFQRIKPFGGYEDDPLSIYFEKEIEPDLTD